MTNTRFATMTNAEAHHSACTIMQQLGGSRFVAMSGARNIGYMQDGSATFAVGRNPRGITQCRVTLDRSRDLYTMTLYVGRPLKLRVAVVVEGVQADQLAEVFTRHTDLYTSL